MTPRSVMKNTNIQVTCTKYNEKKLDVGIGKLRGEL